MDEQDLSILHTGTFCYDFECSCHADRDNINQLEQDLKDGLVSQDDCTLIFTGTTV